MERVTREPTSFNSLRRELQDLMGDAEDDEVIRLLHEVLGSLSKIGLIQSHEEVS